MPPETGSGIDSLATIGTSLQQVLRVGRCAAVLKALQFRFVVPIDRHGGILSVDHGTCQRTACGMIAHASHPVKAAMSYVLEKPRPA